MVSVVAAIMVTSIIFGHSFFDRQLIDRGIDISQGRGHLEMTETPVTSIVSDGYPRIELGDTVENVMTLFKDSGSTEGYVLDAGNMFKGKVSIHALIGMPSHAKVDKAIDLEPLSIKHDASLLQAIEVASNFVGETIPIVNRDTGLLVGVVTEADLFGLYLSLQNRVSDLERA
jgi:CIC family chloride channel protein